MSFPKLPQRSLKIAGYDDELIVRAMSVRAFIAMEDARAAGESQMHIMAAIAKHVVPSWSEHSVDEILDNVEVSVLTDVVNASRNMTEMDEGKSVSDQHVSSSSA